MANAELPFFKAHGGASSSRRDDGGSDAAIAAAFAAFHDKVRPSRRRHPYFAASAHFLCGSGGAVLGLTLLALGGSLFLAHMPVGRQEGQVTIGAAGPEMMYKRPPISDDAQLLEMNGAAAGESDTAIATLHAASAQSDADHASDASTLQLAAEAPRITATASLAQDALPEATANFAAAMRLHAIGVGPGGANAADIITSGFAAEELPSVPEPAAGTTIAIGLATLLGVQRLARRQRDDRP